jgi:hypothetical protein
VRTAVGTVHLVPLDARGGEVGEAQLEDVEGGRVFEEEVCCDGDLLALLMLLVVFHTVRWYLSKCYIDMYVCIGTIRRTGLVGFCSTNGLSPSRNIRKCQSLVLYCVYVPATEHSGGQSHLAGLAPKAGIARGSGRAGRLG